MIKYRMYVDEVGNSDLRSAENPNHRFLSLTGVILSLDIVKNQLHPEFEALKAKYFDYHPDDPIIFHRKEIVSAKFPFQNLKDACVRKAFDNDLLSTIKSIDFTVVTVVIDKLEHLSQYHVWCHDPYHYCMEVLLERYVLFLYYKNLVGDIMAESRGGKEDIRLKRAFRRIYEQGTLYVDREAVACTLTSRELKIKSKSNNISGLQLADLLAHPSRREILLENEKIQDAREIIFAEKIVEILREKYNQRNGKVYGYGKKLLP